jgi:hypothetical protein
MSVILFVIESIITFFCLEVFVFPVYLRIRFEHDFTGPHPESPLLVAPMAAMNLNHAILSNILQLTSLLLVLRRISLTVNLSPFSHGGEQAWYNKCEQPLHNAGLDNVCVSGECVFWYEG